MPKKGPSRAQREKSGSSERMQTLVLELNSRIQQLSLANSDLKSLLAITKMPILLLGADLGIKSFTPSATELFDVRSADIGRPITEIARGLEHPTFEQDLRHVIRTHDNLEREVAAAGERTYLMRVLRDPNLEDGNGGIVLTFTDYTERKKEEERQKLLLAEISHRVKNTLAIVQSIAAQTMRRSDSLEIFYQKFSQRLQALGRTHELLSTGEWQSARFREVVFESLKPYEIAPRRIGIEGDDFELKPSAAMALTLLIHELTTNAVKHGALSSRSGHVSIEWVLTRTEQGRALRFNWRETGGPGVTQPTEHGFGLTLIERSVGHEMGGLVRLDFAPEGLSCEFLVPYTPENFRLA
jgi:two-component system, chemotaxis family, CheB/CheR fusion protein